MKHKFKLHSRTEEIRRSRNQLLHSVVGNADKNSKIVDEAFANSIFELSAAEYALICQALSDSMNYKPNINYEAKWQLLLKVKTFQLRMGDNELVGSNKLIGEGDNDG